jgi:transcriptional regulator with XRE-family HTH domain
MRQTYDIKDFVNIETEQSVTTALVQRFIKQRKAFGLTQRTLSVRSGVSYASIRRFETTGDISLKSLLRISSAIDCLDDFNQLFNHMIIKNVRDFRP